MTNWYDNTGGGQPPSQVPADYAVNAPGIAFRCGTCEYIKGQICTNEDPEVANKTVDLANGCCNHYDNPKTKRPTL